MYIILKVKVYNAEAILFDKLDNQIHVKIRYLPSKHVDIDGIHSSFKIFKYIINNIMFHKIK